MIKTDVLIIGGGYAGLSCLLNLRNRCRDLDITLVDADENHLKLTWLHRVLNEPVEHFQKSFSKLAARYRFRFIQTSLELNEDILDEAAREQKIKAGDETVGFRYMVLATGGRVVPRPPEGVLSLTDFKNRGAAALTEKIGRRRRLDTVFVGSGATAIQFLFEYLEYRNRNRLSGEITMFDLNPSVPASETPAASYISDRLRENGVRLLPGHRFLGYENGKVHCENTTDGEKTLLTAGAVFYFTGIRGNPFTLNTDRYCRSRWARIYAAGDITDTDGNGFNSPTAQAAVRKGLCVSQNILNEMNERELKPYDYKPAGYFIGLGSFDAAGWLFSRDNILTGLPAVAAKQSVEVIYDLFINGIDFFSVFDSARKFNIFES